MFRTCPCCKNKFSFLQFSIALITAKRDFGKAENFNCPRCQAVVYFLPFSVESLLLAVITFFSLYLSELIYSSYFATCKPWWCGFVAKTGMTLGAMITLYFIYFVLYPIRCRYETDTEDEEYTNHKRHERDS